MTNIVLYGGMRKDPKVGGGVGGTYEVAKNQTQHSPRNKSETFGTPQAQETCFKMNPVYLKYFL
ncbi:hypothetical protein Lal_00027153 [Lupinus albus]|nr:hypothetical protein Lal_00027153 [Lupinus albus]